jgi:hypothetical protein
MADAAHEAGGHDSWTNHLLQRKEQDTLDRIIHGDETGNYYMVLGCKV